MIIVNKWKYCVISLERGEMKAELRAKFVFSDVFSYFFFMSEVKLPKRIQSIVVWSDKIQVELSRKVWEKYIR